MSALRDAAFAHALAGRAVFPLRPREKTPLTLHGVKEASRDNLAIARWWQRWPDANIGCACGAKSGFWSLDIDGEDGESSLALLVGKFGPLPETVELITGNGRQLFWRHDLAFPVKNTVGKLGLGLDTRGDGGYTILPPSIHPSGRPYAWSVDGDPDIVTLIPSPPGWLVAALQAAQSATGEGGSQRRPVAAIASGPVLEGQRNDSLTRIVGSLLRSGVEPALAYELLAAFNQARCVPPLTEHELDTIFHSILGRELRRAN